MKIKVLWIIAVLWMGVIFWFSSQPADESGKLSFSVGETMLKNSKKYNDLNKNEQEKIIKENDVFVRKAAHVFLFFVLGIILRLISQQYNLTTLQMFWFAAAFCCLYAVSDETHQLFVEGRGCQAADMAIDTAASAVGCAVVSAIIKLRKKQTGN